MPTHFDEIIAPLERDLFLSEYWSKSFVPVPGSPGRFAKMFSWDELNDILEQHDLFPPRLRLVRDGKPIDPGRYVQQGSGVQVLKPASLVNCISDGATLILDGVHELAPAVRKVTESFREVLRATTTANLYAGWRKQKGFDLHWDTQDTMILQVSGRKSWKVYRPTRLHPLPADLNKLPKPTEPPVWDGILEDGDMMYLPRGWWHVAVPLDEPSLHLTVTVMPAAGTDLLTSLISEMKRFDEVRMNVPACASADEQKRYIATMREHIMQCWDDGVMDRFLAEWEANISIRPRIQLPRAPLDAAAPISMESRLRLATNRKLIFIRTLENEVAFYANGVRWVCSPDLAGPLACLNSTALRSVRELCGHLPNPTAATKLTSFLTALAMGGAIWLEGPGTPHLTP